MGFSVLKRNYIVYEIGINKETGWEQRPDNEKNRGERAA
jgi:hypothetical protein